MGALLSDQASPILEGIALFGISVAIVLSSVARSRSARRADRVAQFFWRDVGQAGYIWASGTAVLLGGSVAGVEGLGTPVWLFLGLIAGLVSLAIVLVRRRGRWFSADGTRADDPSRPDRPRLVSTTWEVAILGAGAGGLLVYGASISHSGGHPIHWFLAGIGAALGYALALAAATPRYRLRRAAT